MFGLWFSIVGFIFGLSCSLKAKEKNRATQEWFILGFIFSFFAFMILSLLPPVGKELCNNDELNTEEKFSYSISTR